MNDRPIHISVTTGTIVKILVVLGLAAAAFLLKDVILVVLSAIVVASFVEVVASSLKSRYNIPRGLVVSVVFFGLILVVSTLLYLLVPVFVRELTMLSGQLSAAAPSAGFLQPFQDLGARAFFADIASNSSLRDAISSSGEFLSNLSAAFAGSLSSALGSMVNFILFLVISFYLSMQPRGVESFLRIITPLQYEPYVLDLWKRTERKIALWVQGQLLLGLFVGFLVFLGLWILGVQYALLLGLLAAVAELVPFGIVFATIPAVLISSLGDGIATGLVVLGLYVVIQQLENYVIQPMLVKKVVGVPPLVVIIALFVGVRLAGFWGLVLAVPGAVFCLEMMADIEKRKFLAKNAG